MSITSEVTEMVTALQNAELSAEVVAKAKLLILDQLGCMIAGSQRTESAMLTDYLATIDGIGECSVAGTSHRFCASNAAHANAHAATVLSLDDSYVRMGHPGNTIIPTALAVSEQTDASGPELIRSVVAGYELALRLGIAMRPTAQRQEMVWGYGTWQVFGATTAAAMLHGLPSEKLAEAYGLTACHAPTAFLGKFYDRPMNPLKSNLGWACKGAITAVDLCLTGFEATRSIFDGENGYWVMGGSDRFDPAELLLPLSDRSHILDVGFKPYSACRWIHTTIDCIKTLMATEGLTAQNLVHLEINTAAEFVRRFNGPWPKDLMEAILHIPYCTALELSGKSTAVGLVEQDLGDGELRNLSDRFELTIMPEGDDEFMNRQVTPVRVTARLNDGRQVSSFAEYPSGHPKGPSFGRPEVHSKFIGLCRSVSREEDGHRLMSLVQNIETTSVRELMALTARH